MQRFWTDALAVLAALCLMSACAAAQDDRAAVPLRPEQKSTLTSIATQLGKDNSFALVVGISDFDNMKHLRGTQPEATMVAKALNDHGFTVQRAGENGRLTKKELTAVVAKFLTTYGQRAEHRLIIYFATHGYADTKPGKEDYGFLVASDTLRPGAKGFEESAYSVKELSTALSGLSAQHIFLFFNSCFSGAMVPELRGDEEKTVARPPNAKGLAPEVAAWTLTLLSHNARLVLTAGNDGQTVPDADNPYARAVVDGLGGMADADGDGLILGTELAQFVRGRVARETYKKGRANDPVFAMLAKPKLPDVPRADAPVTAADDTRQGDFIFLSKAGPRDITAAGRDELAEILAARAKRLPQGQFVECADCPVMVEMPGRRTALGRTEVTFAQWDACFRESGCRRYLPDDGLGRGDRPAGGMTWQDAYEFHSWLQTKTKDRCTLYRLPTAREWLTAEGEGSGLGGSIAENGRAVCSGCGPGRDTGSALAVASLPANPLGFHDMEGNLWEWVDQDRQSECKPAEFSNTGACAQDGIVLGGSYATSAASLTPGLEGHLPRTSNERPFSWPTVGMRVACDMK